MIFAISSIWKPFFMHLGSVELMGLQMNIFYLKQFGGTLWVPSWNIIFYLKSVFQYSSNIFYLKKIALQIIFYLKSGLNHHPWIKKLKNPWFWTVFHRPPPKARMPKYLQPGPTSGGTLALSSSGGHPGPGVNVLLILDNFPAKNTKNGSGTKDFQIEDIPKIIPMFEGSILGFLVISTTFALCNIFYLKRVWPHPQKASSIWNNSWISSIITVYTIIVFN